MDRAPVETMKRHFPLFATLLGAFAVCLMSIAAQAADPRSRLLLEQSLAAYDNAWETEDYALLIDRQMPIVTEAIATGNGMSVQSFREAYPKLAAFTFGSLDPLLRRFDIDSADFIDLENGQTLALVPGEYVYGLNGELLQHSLTSVWLLSADAWRFAEVNDPTSLGAVRTAYPVLAERELPYSSVKRINELPAWARGKE